MQDSDPRRALAQQLAPVARAWRQLADATLASLNVSNSTGWCLVWLERLGPDARQTDLAQKIGISEPSLVRTLQHLEAAGYVERSPHPNDRRANRIALTPEGRTAAGKIEAKLADLRRELLADVADDDLATTLRVLDALGQRIKTHRQPVGGQVTGGAP
jgi:MarR family transcriptional regulator for hemolysin